VPTLTSRTLAKKIEGFTLIEMVLILVIVTAVVMALMMNWTGRSISLSAQTDRLKHDIRLAQSLSQTRHERYRLVFVDSTHYQIEDSDGNIFNYETGQNNAFELATQIEFNPIPPDPIIFNTKGVPYRSSSTAYTSPYTITLQTNNQTKQITLEPQTGEVH